MQQSPSWSDAPPRHGGGSSYEFAAPSNPTGRSPESKQAYLHELDAQIQFKKNQERQQRMKQQLEDQRKEREMADYNPWGKGGAGAPYKNADGSNISNLSGIVKTQVGGVSIPAQARAPWLML
jgi:hypothetical protein